MRTSIMKIATIALLVSIIGGCGYRINYSLNEREIARQKPIGLNVAVAVFADQRGDEETDRKARAKAGPDAGDYTADKDFAGNVSEELTRILTAHLEFANSFNQVSLLERRVQDLSQTVRDSLARAGVDAVLCGNIEHFYGYYDRNQGREILLQGGLALGFGLAAGLMTMQTETHSIGGPFSSMEYKETKINPIAVGLGTTLGGMLGSWLESTAQRDVKRQTRLSVSLISMTSADTPWQQNVEISASEHKSMPGIKTATRKQELAVSSLRDAVSQLVESLAKSSLAANAGEARHD